MTPRDTYTCADMARFCGLTLDAFYASAERLYAEDHMPRPYKNSGRKRWWKQPVDAWRAGIVPLVPANDRNPPCPQSIAEQRADLARIYGTA